MARLALSDVRVGSWMYNFIQSQQTGAAMAPVAIEPTSNPFQGPEFEFDDV